MQDNSVYLYSNKVDAYTNPLDSLTLERYRRVYNRNLKVYRGVDNRIDLQLRNYDQKALTISNSIVFNLVSQATGNLVLTKDYTMIADDTTRKIKGRAYVTLTKEEMLYIEQGSYQYSIVQEVRENISDTEYRVVSSTPYYVDSQYGATATLEVVGDVSGAVTESIVVDKFSYVNPFTAGSEDPRYYISSIIDARPRLATPQSLHTFQFYFSNYTGTVTIQGSLEEQGATPSKWSDLLVFTPTSDVEYKNITGRYSWFRIQHKPSSSSGTAKFVVSQSTLLSYNVGVNHEGAGYKIGDTFTISGDRLGGESTTNDLTVVVTSVGSYGRIIDVSWSGISYNGVKTFVVDGTEMVGGTLDKVLYR